MSFSDKIQAIAFNNISDKVAELIAQESEFLTQGIPVDYKQIFETIVMELEAEQYAVSETLSGRLEQGGHYGRL